MLEIASRLYVVSCVPPSRPLAVLSHRLVISDADLYSFADL